MLHPENNNNSEEVSVKVADKTNSLGILGKLSDFMMLVKVRLTLLVVITSVIGYVVVVPSVDLFHMLLLFAGGLFVTSAANTFNQIIERDTDKLMERTANRPLATGRMKLSEAVLFAGILSVLGLSILSYFNFLTGVLGALSLISYSFVYTPLKKYTSYAVLIGAFPGALPPLLGAVSYESSISEMAFFLFIIQFVWQFPHFWAIAWKAYDQYANAGFYLLPGNGEKNRNSATQILVSCLSTIGVGILGFYMVDLNIYGSISLSVLGLIFTYFGYKLYVNRSDKSALQLMFFSLLYLPISLVIMMVC